MTYQIVDANYVMLHMGEMPIVDVRPDFMYDDGHIPTAISIGLQLTKTENGNVPVRWAQKFAAAGIGPADPVIVYCQSGQLAHEACDMLESQGYTELRCYEGSWRDWAKLPSRPIERTERVVRS